ncbi:stAR-related lipid transfer protein 3-like isoform X2 [Halichondria panicea]|uniref:stAR-related lipid transfer protein 3-like isoform X2 n=1 Tax=Halichondria panicea TaxID=6063 RepID=UPI00312B77DE
MSQLSVDNRYRPLRSFTGSVQPEDSMSSTNYHTASAQDSSYNGSTRGSMTDEDLEVARQRLLQAQAEDEEPEVSSIAPLLPAYEPPYQGGVANGFPHTTILVDDQLPDNQSRTSRYGSMSTTVSTQRKTVNEKRYRLPLLILLGFDWGIVVFMSIICFVLNGAYKIGTVKGCIPPGKANLSQNMLDNVAPNCTPPNYWSLDINQGFFDLVIISTFCVVCNILTYNLLGLVTRIVMAFTTVASACYIPVKTYFLLKNTVNTKDAMYLVSLILLVFVSFVIPWFVAFFFEFKYLPAEKARLYIPSWWSVKAWIWPRAYVIVNHPETPPLPEHPTPLPISPSPMHRRSVSAVSLDFRTPIGSSRGSPVMVERTIEDELPPISEEPAFFSEEVSPEYERNLSPEDQVIHRESVIALEGVTEMTRNNDGWNLDRTVSNIKCYTKTINGRKVLKLDGVVEVSAQRLWSILYPGDSTYEWNQSCVINETVHRVDQATDIVYTVSAAMGPVSSRDFVSARRIAFRDGAYYSCSKSVVTDLKPEQSGKVRGDCGPNGYIVIPINSSRCQFIWIYNSNLKGWLPQAVVDQTVSTALIGAFQQLLIYAREQRNNRNRT